MKQLLPHLGLGVGWRPELALALDRYPGLGFVEVIAEDLDPWGQVPAAIERLHQRGKTVIPHGVTLSLGGAERPDVQRLRNLGQLARRFQAPLVSEHLAFVRAGEIESGHLLPLPRTRDALEVIVENVCQARDALPVPLALENVACLVEWPAPEMDEADFLTEILERTDVLLLLDVENVYANARNHGYDAVKFLERVPLERLAYVHIAGGFERHGLYHDTHTRPIPPEVFNLLEELCARTAVPGVLLERDDHWPGENELQAELAAIMAAVERGNTRREGRHVGQ
jgi:uncharacterized protein (UPF0276 family)